MPNGRCRMHGGTSTGRPMTAGGRFSKFLPARLAARYEEARKDAQLLSLSDDLAVLEARLCELLGTLDTEESAAGWARALGLYETALKEGRGPKATAALRELGAVLKAGLGAAAKWAEVDEIMEQRRRLSEAEVKRLAAMGQFITATEGNLLIAALVRAVHENVDDADARRRIARDVARLLGRPAPGEPLRH
jgi:hypothetical protein